MKGFGIRGGLVVAGVVAVSVSSVGVAAAAAKQIKLSGEVVGFTHGLLGGPTGCPDIALFQGKTKVGSFTKDSCGGLTHSTPYRLTGHIKVGAVKGYSRLGLNFEATGSFDHPGPATHGSGQIDSYISKATESVYVKGPGLPKTLHGKFTLTLIT